MTSRSTKHTSSTQLEALEARHERLLRKLGAARIDSDESMLQFEIDYASLLDVESRIRQITREGGK